MTESERDALPERNAALDDGAPPEHSAPGEHEPLDDGAPAEHSAPAGERDATSARGGSWSWNALALGAVGIVGATSGVVAAVLHRAVAYGLPAGLVGALLIAILSGILARAAADIAGVLLNAAALLVAIVALTYLGQGSNVIVADDATSVALLLGAPVGAVLLPVMTPRSWYRDA